MFDNTTTKPNSLSFRFWLWQITIEPVAPNLSALELTPYDARYWSPESIAARIQRSLVRRAETPIETLPETPLTPEIAVSSHNAAESLSVAKAVRAKRSGEVNICLWCGKKFQGLRSDAEYCCPAHRQAAWRAAKKAGAA